jgi:hypothetical protein
MSKKRKSKQKATKNETVEVKVEQDQSSVPPQPPVTPPVEKRTYQYATIAEELNKYRIALDNSLTDASLQRPMAAYGYGIDRIQETRTLLTTVEGLAESQLRAYGLQYEATINCSRLRERANQEYLQLYKLARIAFKRNPGVKAKLNLKGRHAQSVGNWIQEVFTFIDNTLENPEIMAAFAGYNIGADKLQAIKVMVEEVKTAETRQDNFKGESQRSTDIRDKKYEELTEWMYGYLKVARIAFTNDRQQLEKLGVVAR